MFVHVTTGKVEKALNVFDVNKHNKRFRHLSHELRSSFGVNMTVRPHGQLQMRSVAVTTYQLAAWFQ